MIHSESDSEKHSADSDYAEEKEEKDDVIPSISIDFPKVVRFHNSTGLKFMQGFKTKGTLLYVPTFRALIGMSQEMFLYSS